jgi:predicted DNA-binding transcriptional regulator YafY
MYRPTTRVLAVLELLQTHGRMTGDELARRLEVHPRTARRYVEILQDLGIPVTGERGRYGAYRLRPGVKLPPLLFTADEALALTLGLLAARRLGLAAAAPAVEGALAKVERVLPPAVRERVDAVAATLRLDVGRGPAQGPAPDAAPGAAPRDERAAPPPPAGDVVSTLGEATRASRRVRLVYDGGGGRRTQRDVDPYGLVYRRGIWYATGYCHLRRERRLFRLDRIVTATLQESTFTPPADFDPVHEVQRALATMTLPGERRVTVLLETTLAAARERISPAAGTLRATPPGQIPAGVVFRASGPSLEGAAAYLAGLGFPLRVLDPPALRDALRRHVSRLLDA